MKIAGRTKVTAPYFMTYKNNERIGSNLSTKPRFPRFCEDYT
jgi:hypothetical protein